MKLNQIALTDYTYGLLAFGFVERCNLARLLAYMITSTLPKNLSVAFH